MATKNDYTRVPVVPGPQPCGHCGFTKDSFNEELEIGKPHRVIKLGPDLHDSTQWVVWGGNLRKPEYIQTVDKYSFDKMVDVYKSNNYEMDKIKRFLKHSGLVGAYELFEKPID